jgi:hypothetical protein
MTGCHGGQLEYIEFMWVYTGQCNDKREDLIAFEIIDGSVSPSTSNTRIARDASSKKHLYDMLPARVFDIHAKKWSELNKDATTRKQAVIDTINKARVDQVVYQFFLGMKDAFLDEMQSLLSLILLPIQSLSYILTIAKMIAEYLKGNQLDKLQPLLQDMRRSIESVLGQFPKHLVSFIQQNGLEEMKQKLLETLKDYAKKNSAQVAYDAGYLIVSFISPKKTKLITLLDDIAQKAMKQSIRVDYGKHVKIGNKQKKLEPNIKYTCPLGYTYTTDHLGRITHVEGDLKLIPGDRNTKAQKDSRIQCADHGGHLIACRFGGSGDIDNLVSMDAKLNQGEFKKLENRWAKSLEEGKPVQVKISPVYEGDNLRPVGLRLSIKLGIKDGRSKTLKIKLGDRL